MVIWYGNFLKPRVGSLHDAIFTATLVRRRLSYARAPLTLNRARPRAPSRRRARPRIFARLTIRVLEVRSARPGLALDLPFSLLAASRGTSSSSSSLSSSR